MSTSAFDPLHDFERDANTYGSKLKDLHFHNRWTPFSYRFNPNAQSAIFTTEEFSTKEGYLAPQAGKLDFYVHQNANGSPMLSVRQHPDLKIPLHKKVDWGKGLTNEMVNFVHQFDQKLQKQKQKRKIPVKTKPTTAQIATVLTQAKIPFSYRNGEIVIRAKQSEITAAPKWKDSDVEADEHGIETVTIKSDSGPLTVARGDIIEAYDGFKVRKLVVWRFQKLGGMYPYCYAKGDKGGLYVLFANGTMGPATGLTGRGNPGGRIFVGVPEKRLRIKSLKLLQHTN